jgi:phosphoglycolate phosphatase
LVTIQASHHIFTNIQAVIFDKDGTLARSESFLRHLAQRRARLIDAQVPGVQEPLLMAFGIEGEQINPAGLMAVGTRLENEIAAAAYVAETGRSWVEAGKIVRSAFAEAEGTTPKAEATPLIAGSLALVQKLATASVKLAILSSDSTANVQDFVNTFELSPYFQASCGVSELYLTKSDPALIHQLFVQLDVKPQQTLMIGDSELDIEVAHAAGMAGCIGFTGGWTVKTQIAADITIAQFEQISIG